MTQTTRQLLQDSDRLSMPEVIEVALNTETDEAMAFRRVEIRVTLSTSRIEADNR